MQNLLQRDRTAVWRAARIETLERRMLLSLSPTGAEFRLNTFTTSKGAAMLSLVFPAARNRQILRFSAAAALTLIVAGAFLAPTAFAKVARNTIDPLATVSQSGARIRLTGPIEVTAGERVQQRVTVTQRSTGAVAQGFVHFRGTGAAQTWEVIAEVHGDARFVPGPATAVGMARSFSRGQATDAHQWLVNITLVAR